MTPPSDSANTEIWISFGLFIASELIAMSRLRENSVLQMLLNYASKAFPYTLQRKDQTPPVRRLFRR
jgi:hypothetical protein